MNGFTVRRRADARPRVMLCTSNGAGLGHVTRMLAVAERLPGPVEPVMFTLSAALPIPVDTGMCVEHLPSADYVGVPNVQWHGLLEDRVDALIAEYRPSVLLFDGVHPYRGLVDGMRSHRRSLRRVWVRRGMWRPEIGEGALHRARDFDEVIEPGDFAAAYDRGAPVRTMAHVHRVAPIVYDGPDAVLDRADACDHLGLDPGSLNVLVQLGAGTINDVGSLTGQVVSALAGHPAAPHAVVARSVLSKQTDDEETDRVSIVRRYPISRYFAAFDLAVVAAGYNSFHECLAHGLPSLLIPNLATKTDDQDGRSRWAADHGVALRWDGDDETRLHEALDEGLDPARRSEIRERLADLPAATGSREIAALIGGWLP